MRQPTQSLRRIKLIHTAAWAFFAGCILALPVAAWARAFTLALILIGITMVEVVILLVNGMRCPLTDVAARYTHDRRDNFDIYLPEWLARHNKVIFGSLFIGGIVLTLTRWLG